MIIKFFKKLFSKAEKSPLERIAGGPLVKHYGTHFLRDDCEIRADEAYSLFQIDPYGRVAVYAGAREWAIAQSDALVAKSLEDTLDASETPEPRR